MPLRFLLDTNLVGFHVRASSRPLQRRLAKTPAAHVALSVVTEMEIRDGLARNPSLRVAPLIERFLSSMTIAPINSDVVLVYGTIRAALEARGTPIGPLDVMIAAHAITLNLTLITNNLDEFGRVPGLRCQDWSGEKIRSVGAVPARRRRPAV